MRTTRRLSTRFRVFSIATGLQVTPGALHDRRISRRWATEGVSKSKCKSNAKKMEEEKWPTKDRFN